MMSLLEKAGQKQFQLLKTLQLEFLKALCIIDFFHLILLMLG